MVQQLAITKLSMVGLMTWHILIYLQTFLLENPNQRDKKVKQWRCQIKLKKSLVLKRLKQIFDFYSNTDIFDIYTE